MRFYFEKQSPELIEGLLPRGLLGTSKQFCSTTCTSEGLCPVRMTIKEGRIVAIDPIAEKVGSSLNILLPRLVEPHAHLDKAFTWQKNPNLIGTYQEALNVNLSEHETRSIEVVCSRGQQSLDLAVRNGIRAIRSHVDIYDAPVYQSWQALIDLKNEWASLIDLELVALAPLLFWSTETGKEFALRVAKDRGVLGSVIVPPFRKDIVRIALRKLLALASEISCGIDLHIDESQAYPAEGVKLLVELLDEMNASIPITCSHASSMSLLKNNDLLVLMDRLFDHSVSVVALPLTNAWLLGRHPKKTPLNRPMAPVFQLQQAGITVAIGCDNVQDPWFPAGNFDPLSLMSAAMPLAHLAPWNRLGLAPFTTAAAALMDLEWDGTFHLGSPADLIVLQASHWAKALSSPPPREVMINGQWLRKLDTSTDSSK